MINVLLAVATIGVALVSMHRHGAWLLHLVRIENHRWPMFFHSALIVVWMVLAVAMGFVAVRGGGSDPFIGPVFLRPGVILVGVLNFGLWGERSRGNA